MPTKTFRTRRRPLHERLYQTGPRAGWPGRAEVDDAEQEFIYHHDWPALGTVWMTFTATRPLAHLVAVGDWERVMDPALKVSEGL